MTNGHRLHRGWLRQHFFFGLAVTSLLAFTVAPHPRVSGMTLWRQCWLFMIGSALFAIGTAPGFSAAVSATATNALCFAGSWFFTSAAFLQLMQSRSPASRSWADP